MKISELIAKLQEIQAQHGDLRVWFDQYGAVDDARVIPLGDMAEWADGEEAKEPIVQLT